MILRTIKSWYQNKYSNNEPILFVGLLVLSFLVLTFLGSYIAPILAAVVIAYLLDTFVNIFHKYTRINRKILVYVVFIIFMIILFAVIFVLLPSVFNQLIDFIKQSSSALPGLKNSLNELSDKIPFLTQKRMDLIVDWFNSIDWKSFWSTVGSFILKNTPTTLTITFSSLIYLFLVPLMVFYFLTDKTRIISWIASFIPENNGALNDVWSYLKLKLANYVFGKTIEFVVVSIATYIGFICFDLNYALLLAVGVGLSVIIPYIGMVIITIPVILVGAIQYGFSMTFVWMLVVYFIIQILDGNLLVPLLFSEVLNIHPIGVISSILIFGGIWGLWGIFFAIPLGLVFISAVNIFRDSRKSKI